MKLAVAYDQTTEKIPERLEDTLHFMIYEFEGEMFVSVEAVSLMGKTIFNAAEMLTMMDVDTLICGSLGYELYETIYDEGIHIIYDVDGKCDTAAFAFMKGQLSPEGVIDEKVEE